MKGKQFISDVMKAGAAVTGLEIAGTLMSWIIGIGASVGIATLVYKNRGRLRELLPAA